MVTLFYCLRRPSSMTFEEFGAHWNGPHAELVKRLAPKLGVLRYIQHHALAPEAARVMQGMRGLEEPFDGVAEICFESMEALQKGNLDPSVADAQAELAGDEAKFIDFARSSILFTEAKAVIS